MSLDNSDKPVEHYSVYKFASVSLSTYLFRPKLCPHSLRLTFNGYINRNILLFSILYDGN